MIWNFIAFFLAAAAAGLNASEGNWGWVVFLGLMALANLAFLIMEAQR